MSYSVKMSTKDVVCKFPVSELSTLAKTFHKVTVNKDKVELVWEWEEDGAPITGQIIGDEIILDAKQHGTYKNSSDGGLSYLLTKYFGSGTVTEDGEASGDNSVHKYTSGEIKVGRVTFDDADIQSEPVTEKNDSETDKKKKFNRFALD